MTKQRRRAAGFSVIEVMVAAGLLLIVAVGILPLFVRAIASNATGNQSTQVSNFGKSEVEDLYALPFDSVDLTLTAGTELLVPPQYWDQGSTAVAGDETWVAAASPNTLWQRDVTVRQFQVITPPAVGVTALVPQVFDAEPSDVHLKQITVRVRGTREAAGPLGPGRDITFTALKVF